MKNVLTLGASGTIATQVIALLAKETDINLTLFAQKQLPPTSAE